MNLTPSQTLRTLCAVFLVVATVRGIFFSPVASSVPQEDGVLVESTVLRVEVGVDRQKITLEDGLLAFIPRYPLVHYGDRVRLMCDMSSPEPFEGFAYDRYLAAKGIDRLCFTRKTPIVIGEDRGGVMMGTLQDWRAGVMATIDLAYGEPHASLLAGLLFGEKRFSDRWEQLFIRTGTSHIVAASGYNVSMVMIISSFVLATLGMRRRKAFGFLIAATVGYVLFAGFETAVIRAGVMGALVMTSYQVGRKTTMTNVLLLTAAIMLTINPRLLLDDAAFGLSFLSTIGLICLTPKWKISWTWIPERFLIRESLTSTLAATLMSFPILIFQFGKISLVSVFTNVLILPAVPFVMASGALSIFVSPLSVDIARLASLPTVAGLNWMLWIVEKGADLPLYFDVPAMLSVILFILWLILMKRIWTRSVLLKSFSV
ncbi:ComEC/Rec2 family competence protein [Candidatus Uhrbacteria bacterium]|jgi:competence protein ComEC|nr:ComEC/Rec2 family competence protein [Candidatus Uhrbacteria bacterium]